MKYTGKCSVKGRIYAVVLLMLAAAGTGAADVRLPSLIGDNMVIQRDMPVRVWGWADPCEKVTVKLGESQAATKADAKGNWQADLAAMPAGGPYEMTVAGKNTLKVQNILAGEVWVCSGQSNMACGIGTAENGKAEAAAANYPNIRLFMVAEKMSAQPLSNTEGKWEMCSPKTISYGGWQGFSAAAYFFGRELHKELNVPIGLVQSAWGGKRIEPWTPKCGFESVGGKLTKYVDEIATDNENYKKTKAVVLPQYEAWLSAAKAEAAAGRDVTGPPAWPRHPLEQQDKPTCIYNAMINPLLPLRIRGVIWYQGESNIGEGMSYYEKMKALINGWRMEWKEGDFPFFFAQLAPYNYMRDWKRPTPYDLPEMWEAQIASMSIPNTGMAATTDAGDPDDIHPMRKQAVGKRLALWAMAKTYGRNIVYCGPMYKSMKVEDGRIRVSFDYAEGGLVCGDGKDLSWFEVAGEDKQFVKASARIEGQTVVVWSEQVTKPVAVRFAWNDLAEPNLYNKAGLPALPFRTEKW